MRTTVAEISQSVTDNIDNIEIGNFSTIGSPMNSPWSSFFSISCHSTVFSWAVSLAGSSRSAIRIRVSAVRLEHVPTFLFFMCATPRAMGRSLVTIYTIGDFSFPHSFPVFTSTIVDRRVPFRRRWVYMGTGYPSESNDPSPLLLLLPSNLSLLRIHVHTRTLFLSLSLCPCLFLFTTVPL